MSAGAPDPAMTIAACSLCAMPIESKILVHAAGSPPITLKEGIAAASGSETISAKRTFSIDNLPARRIPEAQTQVVIVRAARIVLVHGVNSVQPVCRQIHARPHA